MKPCVVSLHPTLVLAQKNEMPSAAESPLPPPTLLSMPLIISLSILSTVAIVLLALHLLFKKLCSTTSRSIRGPNGAGGIDRKLLDSIPIFSYAIAKDALGSDEHECAVCLGVFKEGDQVRSLPGCHHVFHVNCIDTWLSLHSNCPLCRLEVVPSAPESVVLHVNAVEGLAADDDGSLGRDGNASRSLARSGSLLWPCGASRLLSFREKLRLKRFSSIDCFNALYNGQHVRDVESLPSTSSN